MHFASQRNGYFRHFASQRNHFLLATSDMLTRNTMNQPLQLSPQLTPFLLDCTWQKKQQPDNKLRLPFTSFSDDKIQYGWFLVTFIRIVIGTTTNATEIFGRFEFPVKGVLARYTHIFQTLWTEISFPFDFDPGIFGFSAESKTLVIRNKIKENGCLSFARKSPDSSVCLI